MDPAEVIPASQAPEGARLDEWIAAHGALWPSDAFVVALDVCARASWLTDRQLGDVIGSLNPAAFARGQQGEWSWRPASTGLAQAVPDAEVIERLGALLFYCLTGHPLEYPLQGETALRSRLRTLRPGLPPGVADLTVAALLARRRPGLTLAAFAQDLRQTLGIERQPGTIRSSGRMRFLAATAVALAATLVVWWMARPAYDERIEGHGLTRRETTLLDISTETAQNFALVHEHTAAIQLYQEIARLWRTRVAPDDPRVAWNEANEAWVRTLAGDRLTTEQLLENKPSWFAAQFGEGHPYTRALRLALAATLDARGATDQAATLRGLVEHATGDLFRDTGLAPHELDDAPVPPGVFAHVAPNDAEREGFRRQADGTFFVPLTSTERRIAGRDGWRLHLVAVGTCRASFVAGADPRRITVNAARGSDSRWQVRIEGITPAITLHGAAATRLGASLVARGGGVLDARVGEHDIQSAAIDRAASLPSPPYSLAFDGEHGDTDCAVVWLEIPFPRASTFNRSLYPVRP